LFGLKLLFNFGIFKLTCTRKPRVFFGKLLLFLKTVQVYSSDNKNLLMLRLVHPLVESSASNLLALYHCDRCKLVIKILSSSPNAERHVYKHCSDVRMT